MNPPPYLSGTAAKRLEWVVVVASAAALPIHAFVTAHQSKPVAAFGLFACLGPAVTDGCQLSSHSDSTWFTDAFPVHELAIVQPHHAADAGQPFKSVTIRMPSAAGSHR